MSLWILQNEFAAGVATDLRTLCPDPGLSIDLGTATQRGTGRVSYTQSRSSVGCNLVAALVSSPCFVGIRGEASAYPTPPPPNAQLHTNAGLTIYDRYPGTTMVEVIYDVEACFGRGAWVQDASGTRIPFPRDVVLVHELAHAYLLCTESFTLVSGNDPASEEVDARAKENAYRAERGMPIRYGHGGGCYEPPPRKPPGSTTGNTPGKSGRGRGCFIATAAYGSPSEPEVAFLRGFRDGVLRRTRAGEAFFARYWEHYYRVSPLIVREMQRDPEVRELVRWSVVDPMVRYLRLLVEMPNAEPPVEEPWRSFVGQLRDDLERWTAEIELPSELASLSPEDAAAELEVLLRYVLRSTARRAAYLEELRERDQLPLRVDAARRRAIAARLRGSGRSDEELRLILGEEREPPSPARRRAARGMNGDELRTRAQAPEQAWYYTVTITNYTTDTFTEIVLFYKVRNLSGVIFLAAPDVQPNETIVFQLGACDRMESYAFAGYIGSSEAFRFPAQGNMTPQLASQLKPSDTEACADSWGIT